MNGRKAKQLRRLASSVFANHKQDPKNIVSERTIYKRLKRNYTRGDLYI